VKLIGLLTLAMVSTSILAQSTPPPTPTPTVTPTEVTAKVLDPLAHAQVLLAIEKETTLTLSAAAMSGEYKEKMSEMKAQYAVLEGQEAAWVERVRKDNGWDTSYVYDQSKDAWYKTAAPPAPPAATPAPPATPKK